MESNAAALVRRPALKTGFSEMGWGSTPLLSARLCRMRRKVRQSKLFCFRIVTASIKTSWFDSNIRRQVLG